MGKTKTSSNALERIKANCNNEPRSRKIDAWSTDDDEFIIYWSPITLAEKQKVQKHARGDDQETSVYTLIFKATDQDGNKLFDLGDKKPLMSEIGSKEIDDVVLEILGLADEELTPEK